MPFPTIRSNLRAPAPRSFGSCGPDGLRQVVNMAEVSVGGKVLWLVKRTAAPARTLRRGEVFSLIDCCAASHRTPRRVGMGLGRPGPTGCQPGRKAHAGGGCPLHRETIFPNRGMPEGLRRHIRFRRFLGNESRDRAHCQSSCGRSCENNGHRHVASRSIVARPARVKLLQRAGTIACWRCPPPLTAAPGEPMMSAGNPRPETPL
jgi:hypothetical protein